MRRLLVLLALASVPAIVAFRRLWNASVPEYPDWRAYVEADDEGDALPPALVPDPRIALIWGEEHIWDQEKLDEAGSLGRDNLAVYVTTADDDMSGWAGA